MCAHACVRGRAGALASGQRRRWRRAAWRMVSRSCIWAEGGASAGGQQAAGGWVAGAGLWWVGVGSAGGRDKKWRRWRARPRARSRGHPPSTTASRVSPAPNTSAVLLPPQSMVVAAAPLVERSVMAWPPNVRLVLLGPE